MKAYKKEFEPSDDEYARYLTEIYGEVSICGQMFSAGWALQQLDETAFRIGKGEWEGLVTHSQTVWVCDNCGEEYEEKEDANECCSECEGDYSDCLG